MFTGSAWAQLLLNAQTLQSTRISHEKHRRHFNQNKMPLWKLEGAQLRHMQDQRLSGTVVRLTDEPSARSASLSTTSERLKCCRCRWKEPSLLSCTLVLIHLRLFHFLAWRLSLIVLTLKKASFAESKSSSEGLWPPTPQCYKFPGLRCEIGLLSAARGHAWCQSGRDTNENINFCFF